jgi:hypothetical protein
VNVVEVPVAGLIEASAGGLPWPLGFARENVTVWLTVRLTLAVPAGLNSIVGFASGDVNCRVEELCPPPPELDELEQPTASQHIKEHTNNATIRLLVATPIPSGDKSSGQPARTTDAPG